MSNPIIKLHDDRVTDARDRSKACFQENLIVDKENLVLLSSSQ
jgi:hypothetical protein